MELFNHADWAHWSTSEHIPAKELKNTASQNTNVMEHAEECLEASRAKCIAVQNFYKEIQADKEAGNILKAGESAGSIPSLMSKAMKRVHELENVHCQKMAELIYDPDGTCKHSVKEVRQMLQAAGRCIAMLVQDFNEAKSLVAKFKVNLKKPEKDRYKKFMLAEPEY